MIPTEVPPSLIWNAEFVALQSVAETIAA